VFLETHDWVNTLGEEGGSSRRTGVLKEKKPLSIAACKGAPGKWGPLVSKYASQEGVFLGAPDFSLVGVPGAVFYFGPLPRGRVILEQTTGV